MGSNLRALSALLLLILAIARPCGGQQVVFNTASAWTTNAGIFIGFGPGQGTTVGETIIAPNAPEVMLNNFTFYAQALPSGANLQLQAFVYSWSGNVTGTNGGAIGSPLYLSPAFSYSPAPRVANPWAGPWTPLTATIPGQGISLDPGQAYVIGVTLSDPVNYAASTGEIEFQNVPPYQIPAGTATGGGEAVWDNNGNDFAELNTAPWSTWGNIGPLSFVADITVVPEPSVTILGLLAAAICFVPLWRPWRRVSDS